MNIEFDIKSIPYANDVYKLKFILVRVEDYVVATIAL